MPVQASMLLSATRLRPAVISVFILILLILILAEWLRLCQMGDNYTQRESYFYCRCDVTPSTCFVTGGHQLVSSEALLMLSLAKC